MTEKMRIDKSGNVGIGTATPTNGKLNIYDNINGTFEALNLSNHYSAGTSGTAIKMGYTAAYYGVRMTTYHQPASYYPAELAFERGNGSGYSESMRIDRSGNVGIGTATPTQPLDVNGSLMVRGNILSSGSMQLGTGATTGDVSIDVGSGRVGNGYAYIDLIGDGTYTDFGTRLIRSNSGPNAPSYLQHHGTGSLFLYTLEAAPIDFYTTSTARMRIGSDGNVGIGTETATYKLDVTGEVRLANNGNRPTVVESTGMISTTGDTGGWAFGHRVKGSSGTDHGGFGFYGGADNLNYYYVGHDYSTPTMVITSGSGGRVGIGTVSPNTTLHVSGNAQLMSLVGADHAYIGWYPDGIATRKGYMGYPASSTNDFTIANEIASAHIILTTNGGAVIINNTSAGNNSKLDVSLGKIRAGTVTSTNGSTIIEGAYTNGAITTFGTEYSSGGPVLGYGVTPSTASADSFFSSTGINANRGAYVMAGGEHKWSSATAASIVAIGTVVSLAETMRLTDAGRLGIGTTTPSSTLDVNGLLTTSGSTGISHGIRMVRSGWTSAFRLGAVSSSGDDFWITSNWNPSTAAQDSSEAGYITLAPKNELRTVIGGTRMATVTTTGVGIGTTSPGTLLDISGTTPTARVIGTSGTTPKLTLSSAGVTAWSFRTSGSDSSFRLDQDGTDRITVLSGGNVGIGTTSPGSTLHIQGNVSASSLTVSGLSSVQSIIERVTITGSAVPTTLNYNILDQAVWFHSASSANNWTLNFRGNASTPLNTVMATGQSLTATLMVLNGATAYSASAYQIDGTAITPRWQGGTTGSANVNSLDAHTFTIIKTSATPTYVVLGSITKYT
jgi:hypothetical protein